MRPHAVLLAGCIIGVSVFGPALAAAGTKECIAAADDGQKLRDEGKLTAARDKFIACSAKACPGAVAKQCSAWLVDAEKDMPSIAFRALDDQGKETLEVKVSVDGAQVATAIEARAIPADPGEHIVKFERADGVSVEDKVLLRPGEKNRIIELSFQPKMVAPVAKPGVPVTPPTPEESQPLRVPLVAWIGLGVGVVGGAMTAAFAVSANSDESHLRETCAPKCDPADRSAIDTKVVFANIGLGVGIVGLGVAVVTTILANSASKPAKKEPPPPVAFDVGPGSLLLRGAF